ncbi:MAG: hypothetical protein RIS45_480, partial [Planctomycetota bacterium]
MAHVDWKTDDIDSLRVEYIDADHVLVHVGSFDLAFSTEWPDGKPRVLDLAYADWLGYERTHDIRELIGRMKSRSRLPGVVFRTVRKTTGGRPGREFAGWV